MSTCPYGYWANKVNLQCALCAFPCVSCVGSATACNSCAASYFLMGNAC